MTDKIFEKGRLTRDVLKDKRHADTAEKVLTGILVVPATAVLDAPETLASAAEDVFDAVGSFFDF